MATLASSSSSTQFPQRKRRTCEHGKFQPYCKNCKGNMLCTHLRHKNRCAICKRSRGKNSNIVFVVTTVIRWEIPGAMAMFDDCSWHSYFALNPNRSSMTLVADVTTQALKIIYIVPFLLISGQLLHWCQWMVKKQQLLRCCQGELRKLVRVRGSGTHSNPKWPNDSALPRACRITNRKCG